ncbi:peptidylprolyl isomerase, partial [Bordetella avium]|uniref:peptidylprolyl isomerase n=1 Tax=Bordetella avium TaxID=521 RepID=UPI0039FBE099
MMRRLHSSRRFSGSLLALALGLALPLAHAADKPAAGKPAASQPAASKPQAGEQFVDGIAAIVNKDVITMREVQDGVKRAKVDLKERGIQLPDDKVLQKQVLQRLIFDRLERQEADRLGIRVDDAQVTQAINMVASRNKLTPQQLRAEVEKNGLSWDDYRKSLREEIRTDRLRQRTIDNHIIITDAEVDAYLKDQARNPALQPQSAQAPVQEAPAAATGPVMLALGQILVRVPEGASPDTVASLRKKAEDILARLKRGDDFASVAAASSDGPEALEGGVMGVRPIDGWPDLFVKAVSNVPAGQVSGIIQSGNGFHILKVLQRGQAGAPAPARAAAPMPAPAADR